MLHHESLKRDTPPHPPPTRPLTQFKLCCRPQWCVTTMGNSSACWTPHWKHRSHIIIITLTILPSFNLQRFFSFLTDSSLETSSLLFKKENSQQFLQNRSQAQMELQEAVAAVGGWRWQRCQQDPGSLGAAGHWAQLLLTHTLFWKVLKGLAVVNNIPTLCVCRSYFGLSGGGRGGRGGGAERW